MQFRIRASAPFVDLNAALKPFQIVIFNNAVWPVIGNQVGKKPSGSGAGLEATIVPTRVQIQIVQRRFARLRPDRWNETKIQQQKKKLSAALKWMTGPTAALFQYRILHEP